MGNTQSASPPSPTQSPAAPQACAAAAAAANADPQEAGSCPVNPKYKNPAVYNVYGERLNDPSNPLPQSPLASIQGANVLDPKNNMPLEANQTPCPGQRKPLSIERVASTIPKGGTESTWLYPSPQMVFNGGWWQRVPQKASCHSRQPPARSWHCQQRTPGGLAFCMPAA